MDGYIQFYPSVEVDAQELTQFATDFIRNAGVVREVDTGNLGFSAAELSPLDGLKYNVTTGGRAYVLNDGYAANGTNPKYWLTRFAGATETLTFASNSSGSTRIDLICVFVDTSVSDGNSDNTGVASLVVVQGTPGAGVPATPANHLALYRVTVADGATNIEDVNVTDVRVEARSVLSPMDNNEFLRGRNTSGVNRNLIGIESSNNIHVGENNQAGHTVINAGPSHLAKIKVLRQNITTGSYVDNTVILTGWSYVNGNGSDRRRVGPSINFGITFSEVPIVTASGMYLTSSATPANAGNFSTLGNSSSGDVINVMLGAITTSSFSWTGYAVNTGGNASTIPLSTQSIGIHWHAIGQFT